MNIPELIESLRIAYGRAVTETLPTEAERARMGAALAAADATLAQSTTPTPWVMAMLRRLPAGLRRYAAGQAEIATRIPRIDPAAAAAYIRQWLERDGWRINAEEGELFSGYTTFHAMKRDPDEVLVSIVVNTVTGTVRLYPG